MPNYLSESDWKTELKRKENKEVSDTGISGALRDYEKAAKAGGDGADQALDELIKTARSAGTKYKKLSGLSTYLDHIAKEATTEKQKIAQAAANDPIKELTQRLGSAKNAARENPFNFICAPGKVTGLWVTKSAIGNSHRDIVKDQRGKGKGGPILGGVTYGENNKLVFDFGQSAPPSGIAKAISKAIRNLCELSYKVIVRGGGVSSDDDQDAEVSFDLPFEEATGIPDFKAPSEDSTATTPTGPALTTDAEWAKWLKSVQDAPTEAERDGILDGMRGKARLDATRIASDSTLSAQQKAALVKKIKGHIDAAKQLVTQAPAQPETATPQTASTAERRAEIHGIMGKNVELIEKAAFSKGGADAITRRAELMQGGRLDEIAKLMKACETDKKTANLDALRKACDAADQEFDRLRQIKEDPFPTGGVQAVRDRTDLKITSGFKTCLKRADIAESVVAEPPDDNTDEARAEHNKRVAECGASLGQACAAYFQALGNPAANQLTAEGKIVREWQERAWLLENPGRIEAQASVALLGRTRVRLTEIAAEYKALGDPTTWKREQEETASELLAAYLFEEGTVTSKATFGAAASASKTANSSFRVARKAVQRKPDPNAPVNPKAKDGEELYIFKPMEGEETVLYGLPAGSGAAREIFAKDLGDFLQASTGLKTKICPTDFVGIERSKLPGQQGKSGQCKGSMQRLGAKIDNGIERAILADPNLAAKIDKDEYDDLAVFDLITGHLDRHGDNVLIVNDAGKGVPELVAIDHGTSMPDPDTLKRNRYRLLDTQNYLVRNELPQGGQPLGQGACDRLKKLKPEEMTKAIRASQDRLRQRHTELAKPETGLSDEQITLMERSAQLMKALAGKVTVRQMFQAKTRFVDEIMKDPAPDWDKLSDRIAVQLKEEDTAVQQLGGLLPASGKWADFPFERLIQLGWCHGLGQQEMLCWVLENPKRAVKILAGSVQNPALKEQVASLRQEFGGAPNVPHVSDSIDDLSKEHHQLSQLSSVLPGGGTDQTALDGAYQALGGDAELKKVTDLCGGERRYLKELETDVREKKGDAQAVLALTGRRVECLQQWKKFEAAGGLKELTKLGGLQAESMRNMYDQLIALKEMPKCLAAIDKVPDDQVAKRLQDEVKQLWTDTAAQLKKVATPGSITDFQKVYTAADDGFKKDGNALRAQSELKQLLAKINTRLAREKEILDAHRKDVTDFEKKIGTAKIDTALQSRLDTLKKTKDADVLTNDSALKKERARLGAELDLAINGANSEAGKIQAALDAIQSKSGAAVTGTAYPALAALYQSLSAKRKAFDLTGLADPVKALGQICGWLPEIAKLEQDLAALGNAGGDSALAKVVGELRALFARTDHLAANLRDAVEAKLKRARKIQAG